MLKCSVYEFKKHPNMNVKRRRVQQSQMKGTAGVFLVMSLTNELYVSSQVPVV